MLILLFPLSMASQDLIHFIDGSIQMGKVRERDSSLIIFSRPGNKLKFFSISQKDVNKIRYHDGRLDSFPQNRQRLGNQTLVMDVKQMRTHLDIRGHKVFVYDYKVKDKDLLLLIRDINNQGEKERLEKDYLYMHRLKKSRLAFMIAGAVVAGSFGTMALAESSLGGVYTVQFASVMCSSGIALGVIPSYFIKKKYRLKRAALAKAYNDYGSTEIRDKF